VHNVLAVRAITIEGDAIALGSEALDAPGYDLLALVTGSEGLLAITLEVTVKLLPKPEAAQVVMASFPDVESAGEAVAAVIGAGIVPAGLEMMDRMATRAVEDFVHAGYDLEAEAILLAESDGTREEVEHETARMIEVMRACGATDIRCSSSDAERLRFWSGRKAAFPAVGRISPDYYCIDGSIPRGALARVLKRIEELSAACGLRCANVFQAGDGNLHPLILYDANVPGELEKTERFAADIRELCIAVGGTITGEHGVGVLKRAWLEREAGPVAMAVHRSVKSALDPLGILNPGKVFDPT